MCTLTAALHLPAQVAPQMDLCIHSAAERAFTSAWPPPATAQHCSAREHCKRGFSTSPSTNQVVLVSKADFSEAEENLGKLWLTLTLICSLNTLLRLLSSALENVKTEERVLCPALKRRYYLFFAYPALPDFLSVPGPSPQSLGTAGSMDTGTWAAGGLQQTSKARPSPAR